VFIKLRQRGVYIVVNTRNPEEHDYEYEEQATIAIRAMQEIDIKVFYTVKHHRKLTVIDKEILWEGSLNILSQHDSCEMMRRIESRALVEQLLKFIGMNKYL